MKEYYSMNLGKYSHLGWKYYSDKEVELDGHNSKIWHYVVDPTGIEHTMDFSPYQYPNQDQVVLFIEGLIDAASKLADM